MSRFVAIDLASMTPPDIIETLSFETILQALKDDASERMEELGLDFDVTDLESDPAIKILEVAAAREVVLRARVNGAAKALLLALAQKNDLAHLGAWFGVERATNADGSKESDDRLRERVQLAPEAFSTAGPHGAYEFHALTAAPTVKHVGIDNPKPGSVVVYPLVNSGNGLPSAEVLEAIRDRLLDEPVRPLTDVVTVKAPSLIIQPIDVTLLIKEGPDPNALVAAAKAAIQTYANSRHKVGFKLAKSGIFQAAQVPGVEEVLINSPAQTVDPGIGGAVFVDSITVAFKLISP